MLCLWLVCPAARAAHWVVSYKASGKCTAAPAPAQGSPVTWVATSNTNSIMPGSAAAASYTCASSGTITPVLTWTPDFAGDTAPAPASAAVQVTSTASTGVYTGFTAACTPAASDGFGDAAVSSGGGRDYNSQGQRLFFKDNSSHALVVTFSAVSLSASLTVPASASTMPSMISAGCSVVAAVVPFGINLTGTTPDATGNANILVGQGCGASLSGVPSGFTVDPKSYQWLVHGTTFQSWTGTQNLTATPPTSSAKSVYKKARFCV